MLSISLHRTFEDQGSGYPLRVPNVTLKWTSPVKMLTALGAKLSQEIRNFLVKHRELFADKASTASLNIFPSNKNS